MPDCDIVLIARILVRFGEIGLGGLLLGRIMKLYALTQQISDISSTFIPSSSFRVTLISPRDSLKCQPFQSQGINESYGQAKVHLVVHKKC